MIEHNSNWVNLAGKTIGNFTVIEEVNPTYSGGGKRFVEKWRCRCNLCGNDRYIITKNQLVHKTPKSCGCQRKSGPRKPKETIIKRPIIHPQTPAVLSTLTKESEVYDKTVSVIKGSNKSFSSCKDLSDSVMSSIVKKPEPIKYPMRKQVQYQSPVRKKSTVVLNDLFGDLLVIDKKKICDPKTKQTTHLFVCRCACGGKIDATKQDLLNGKVKNCDSSVHNIPFIKGSSLNINIHDRFGDLEVIKKPVDSLTGKESDSVVICRCKCNTTFPTYKFYLTEGKVTNCSGKNHEVVKPVVPDKPKKEFVSEDITGNEFGEFTVVGKAEPKVFTNRHGYTRTVEMWKCACKHGHKIIVSKGDLFTGKVKECEICKEELTRIEELKTPILADIEELKTIISAKEDEIVNVEITPEIQKFLDEKGFKRRICKRHNYGYKDLTNQRFNKLVALFSVEPINEEDNKKYEKWLCKCDCGNFSIVHKTNLISHNIKSCGCYRGEANKSKMKLIPPGSRFGHLTVLDVPPVHKIVGKASFNFYTCECDCGNITSICSCHLKKQKYCSLTCPCKSGIFDD